MDDPLVVPPAPTRAVALVEELRQEVERLNCSGACGDRVPYIITQLEQLKELIELQSKEREGLPPWVWSAISQVSAALIDAMMKGACSYQQPQQLRSSTYAESWFYNQAA